MSTPKTAHSDRRIFVSSALPYANGPLHLGHILETIQTDVWVRLHKMLGHEIYYVCAEDAHGTPVMLLAEREGVSCEQLIETFREQHLRDYEGFSIGFDNFHTTHSEENRRFVESFYRGLEEKGLLIWKPVQQFYDPEREIFLPDRFVKGTCPSCGAEDQYGDSCDNCSSTSRPWEPSPSAIRRVPSTSSSA